MPFFISLRAAIRAKVTAARLALAKTEDHDRIARAAKSYFKLALDALTEAKPVVVATGGLSGTGKSVLARALAPLLPPLPGALVFRSDVERKALHGKAETDRLPAEAYRPEVTENIYRIVADKAARVARAGHSAIADAVFARPDERSAIEATAKAAGAEFHGLFLMADLATRLARIGSRGPDASDADAAVAQQQESLRHRRRRLGDHRRFRNARGDAQPGANRDRPAELKAFANQTIVCADRRSVSTRVLLGEF